MEASSPHPLSQIPGNQPEEPTAAAHLTITPAKLDTEIRVPITQAHGFISMWASLITLVVMEVLGPAIILKVAGPVMPTAWTASLVTIQVTAGAVIAFVCRPHK